MPKKRVKILVNNVNTSYQERRTYIMAGFLDKLSDVINNTADEITDKAKEISEVSSLNSQIRNQEKTIERCYNEIGKLYYEAHKDDTSDAFLEQIERITKAKQEVQRLKKDVENVKNK